MKEKHYISNQDESVRMFKSDFIEMFSHVHPITIYVAFAPVVTYFFYYMSKNGLGFYQNSLLFAFGLFLWTLMEYVLHRFLFHFKPKGDFQKRISFIIHWVHHDYPMDSRRLVMPPPLTVILAAPFITVFWLIFGAPHFLSVFAGVFVGYLMYDTTHYAVHHFKPRTKVGFFLRQHHMRHHYLEPEKNFGVTSPLWDFAFGTFLKGVGQANLHETQEKP